MVPAKQAPTLVQGSNNNPGFYRGPLQALADDKNKTCAFSWGVAPFYSELNVSRNVCHNAAPVYMALEWF